MYLLLHEILSVQIDDWITNDYQMKKLVEQHAKSSKKPSSTKSSVSGKRNVDSVSGVPADLKPFIDRIMNDMKDIHKELVRISELCVQVTFG